MAHDRTSLPNELRPVDVAEDSRIAVPAVPGRPLETVIPSSSPSNLSDSAGYENRVAGTALWNASPPATVGHVGSDLGTKVVSNAHWQSSNEIIAGFGYSQGLNINGNEQLSINATTRNGTNMDSEEGGDGSSSGKKVKFLCSYQGKIMPRPSDGMLRYVGGQTRIITIKNNLRFDELERKMIQVYGQPVVIKYQLPEEDLDALVSVSCNEDIDNMMDEYDKLLERSSDGSAKLRVFLFEASEVDSFEISQYGGALDSGQRYVEAVNGVVGGLANKESIASGSSNPNSDFSGIDVVDSLGLGQSDLVEIRNPSTFSSHDNLATYHNSPPRLVPPDPRSPAYVVPMTVPAAPFSFSQPDTVSEKPIAGKIQQQQQGYELQQPITAPSERHSQTYVDPRLEILRQPDYVHSPNQLLPSIASFFSQEPFQGSALSVSAHQFFPAAHMPMAPLNAQIPATPVLIKPVMQTQENGLGNYPSESNAQIQKLPPLPTEPRYSAYQGTVEPCIPSGGYGWTQVPLSNHVVLSDGVVHQQVIMPESLKKSVEDSDSSTMSVPYVSSAYHTFCPDDAVRIQPTNKFMDQQILNHSIQQERDTLHNANVVTAHVETTEPFLNEIVKEHPIKLQVSGQQENPVGPSVAHGKYRQLSGLVENVKIHAPEIYTSCQNFNSPVDKIGKQDIKGSSSQQMAGHESQLKAFCAPTHSPFLGNPGLHRQSLVGVLQFDSLEAQSSNSAYGVVGSAFDAANLPSSLTSNPDAANLPSSLSSSVGAACLIESSNTLFSNQNPWNLQQDVHPSKTEEAEVNNGRFYSHEHFCENQSLLRGVPHSESHLQDGIHHLEINSKEDAKTDTLSSSKGSEEEYIKQELQNVAEGVAASVLQSSTPSYPEAPIKVDDYASNWKGEVSSNDEMKQQFTHFKDIRNQLRERLNLNYSGSESLDHLQIIMDSDLEELRELGSGTFGTVYHGKWRGTDVAIKRINDRCFAGKPSEQERMIDDFWNEAEKLAGLHHPNVVAFYGVVLDSPGGSVATVTEYMVNGSLRNALQKNVRNLDKRKRLLIAMDIAFGMEYLHGKNIVHFDLKSDNLLVNLRDPHRPICKVGDLGLSKVKCQTLISGGVRGTLPWMAPELLNGISSLVSEKVDVFSFGIVLWELFTGEEPYADLHYGAIIGGIVSNTLRPPIPDLCDMDWKLLMERCWSAEPSERPSFSEIVDKLRSMATKLPSKVQVPSQGPQC